MSIVIYINIFLWDAIMSLENKIQMDYSQKSIAILHYNSVSNFDNSIV